MYPDADVVSALDAARMETYKSLITRATPAYITCTRMIVTAAKGNGDAAPTDMYLCICGYKNDGTYVPYSPLAKGEPYADLGDEQVYVSGRVIYGTMQNIEYWKTPSDSLAPNGNTFTEFPDAFYHAVKYAAVRNLLIKEEADALYRWKPVDEEFQRKVASLA